MIVDAADLYAGEGPDKIARALALYTLDLVRDPGPLAEGYEALDATFGARGELERFELLKAWFSGSLSPPGAPITATYHMVLARDAAGRLAGVRDCFVTLDRAARRCVALLSHALVLPEHRRTGLAALLRAAPVALARGALREAGIDQAGIDQHGAEILLAAEMDPVDPAERDTVVRLFAYGRAGFSVIPPAALPYAQPDFRDVAALGVAPVPLPLLPLMRQVGEEGRPDISRARVEAFLRHFQAVHTCDAGPSDLVPIREHALAGLAAYPHDPVPLLRIPADPSQIAALEPLLRSVFLPLFPPAWRGKAPLDDPARELARLLAAWTGDAARG
jgi:hypothetical protein